MWILALCMVSHHGPPIGATYHSNVKIMFIGEQSIELDIQSRALARIQLNGIINADDFVQYTVFDEGMQFQMSTNMQKMLNRYMVRITDAAYQPDYAQITVFVKPIRWKKKVILYRKILT